MAACCESSFFVIRASSHPRFFIAFTAAAFDARFPNQVSDVFRVFSSTFLADPNPATRSLEPNQALVRSMHIDPCRGPFLRHLGAG